MTTPFITIEQASANYPVYVGRDLLDRVGSLIRPHGAVFVITSSALRTRFAERVAASFSQHVSIITIEEGEPHKDLDTANEVITQLLDRGARRDATAVVVGGGMVGDTAGFAVSIFLRGIDLVHVPTTLLAIVDSSLGGKLAVNHALGKNLIGSFFPPKAVIADTSVVDTLPDRELLSGIYEAMKGGVIGDAHLFSIFEGQREQILRRDAGVIDAVIRRAIEVKARIVSADEREADLRRLLNYGHTIAHGIEAAANYSGITHGEAVAWGMIGANAIAERRGLIDRSVRERIDATILAYEPARIPATARDADILAATAQDKKNVGHQRVMVFPRDIGRCEVFSDIAEAEVVYGIEAMRRVQ